MKVDLLFSTANFAMFRCPVKQILLVRNALYFSRMYQQTLLPRHGLKMRIAFRLRRWMICQSAKSADIVMTPTHAMLNALQTHVQVAATKGIVNHYGVGELVEGKMAHRSIERQSSPVRLLYISLYAEHKNLTTLLKALPLLNRDRNQEFSLKTTVNPNWDAASRMLTHKDDIDLARLPDITPWVKFAGPLSQEEIEEQYRTADIFVFPSITESFGHPMAEAMAHGLPIVAADTPVNREMCGNAALYFSPFEPDELAQAIHRVATDPPLGRSLGLEGKRRARTMFRWDTHVRRILEIAQGTQQEVLQESCQDSLTQQREECLLAPTVTNRPV
jgi:glycosyltransferase involved in cell wall biosynthesis